MEGRYRNVRLAGRPREPEECKLVPVNGIHALNFVGLGSGH